MTWRSPDVYLDVYLERTNRFEIDIRLVSSVANRLLDLKPSSLFYHPSSLLLTWINLNPNMNE